MDAVEKAKEYIRAGDIFQVVPSHRFSARSRSDPFDVYRTLRLVNPSPYMFFLKHPEITLVGSSPEPLIKVRGRRVLQRPIAGSRPRGATPEEDEALGNDLFGRPQGAGRARDACRPRPQRPGPGLQLRIVEVEEFMVIERYSHIMHMTSQVVGELSEGMTGLDALTPHSRPARFPERRKSGPWRSSTNWSPPAGAPYSGVVGYFDFSGNLDTCIALRTAYVVDGKIYIQAGGGIVADSDPQTEWLETVNKAKALLTAWAMARQA